MRSAEWDQSLGQPGEVRQNISAARRVEIGICLSGYLRGIVSSCWRARSRMIQNSARIFCTNAVYANILFDLLLTDPLLLSSRQGEARRCHVGRTGPLGMVLNQHYGAGPQAGPV